MRSRVTVIRAACCAQLHAVARTSSAQAVDSRDELQVLLVVHSSRFCSDCALSATMNARQ
jgi:hypothetical protein